MPHEPLHHMIASLYLAPRYAEPFNGVKPRPKDALMDVKLDALTQPKQQDAIAEQQAVVDGKIRKCPRCGCRTNTLHRHLEMCRRQGMTGWGYTKTKQPG